MHTTAQPGLHAHSWAPEHDLMKRFVVERRTPSGWLAMASFHSATDTQLTNIVAPFRGTAIRITDQFK